VVHEIPATPLASAGIIARDHPVPAVVLVDVNKHFLRRCWGRYRLKNLLMFGKLPMSSSQWSGRTTLLSFLCIKTGVVFDQVQFANKLYDKSELTLRRA